MDDHLTLRRWLALSYTCVRMIRERTALSAKPHTFDSIAVATMNGYDGSLMGSINAMSGCVAIIGVHRSLLRFRQSYLRYYDLPLNGSTSTGLVFSIFQIGQMCGERCRPKIKPRS